MAALSENTIRIRSLVLSLGIHALLLLALIFILIHIPIPPFPDLSGGNGGVLVNIGYLESASGDIQPISENDQTDPVAPSKANQSEESNYITQDDEESVSLDAEKKKSSEKKAESKADVKTEIKVDVPVRTVNQAALYKGKSNQSNSQGTASSGVGDQGNPDGSPDADGYGTPGSGTGTGSGNGTGDGIGDGSGRSGISYSLAGRKIVQRPVINDRSQETGKVVVTITVDKFGKVTKASPGARGTNTSSALLFSLARQSALTARFNASPGAAEEQVGTITFVFIVQ